MNRILIIGISGTGKTHLAQSLGQQTKLPIVYLDSIFWKEDWQEADEKLVKSKIQQAISNDKWIVEGYIEPLGSQRVQRADAVIYLDYSGARAAWGGFQRWLHFRGKVRPEMPAGNVESLGIKFLWTLLTRQERPEIETAINGFEHKVVRLKSRKQTKDYLQSQF